MKSRKVKLIAILATMAIAVSGCGSKPTTKVTEEQTNVDASPSSVEQTSVIDSSANTWSNKVHYKEISEVFEDKCLGIPDDVKKDDYFTTWGKSPFYYHVDNEDFLGAYDFGDDFVSICYKLRADEYIARIYTGDASSFDADSYILEEYKEVFGVENPDKETITEDKDGEKLRFPVTYYHSRVNDGEDYCWATYGYCYLTDEITGREYLLILLTNNAFDVGMVNACEDFYDLWIKVNEDSTYTSDGTYSVKANGQYTMSVFDYEDYKEVNKTITVTFPSVFVTDDEKSKENGEYGTIGIFNRDYGIFVVSPCSMVNQFSIKGTKVLLPDTEFERDRFTATTSEAFTEVESDYRNGDIWSITYHVDEFDRHWTSDAEHTYTLPSDVTDYYYVSKEYPMTIMFHPVNGYDITLDEFASWVSEVLDGVVLDEQ